MSQDAQAPVAIKEQVRRVLDGLPNDCSLEDVQYQLYMLQKVQEGLDEVDAGLGISHEEIAREFLK